MIPEVLLCRVVAVYGKEILLIFFFTFSKVGIYTVAETEDRDWQFSSDCLMPMRILMLTAKLKFVYE